MTDADQFKPFIPGEVLYEFDGPRIFTFLSSSGDTFLAYQFDEGTGQLHYLVVPTNAELIERLKRGTLTVRDALTQPLAWFVQIGEGWQITDARKADIDSLPSDWLPDADVMLNAEPCIGGNL